MNRDISDTLTEVKKALELLIDVRAAGTRVLLSVPVQYPSGALSVVEIEHQGKSWWISDMGHGLLEAEYVSAANGYARAATETARSYGVKFDGHAIFALMVPADQLDSGIVAVSNASVRAASEAIRAESERKLEVKTDQVFDRLSRIFHEQAEVVRKLEIQGEYASWEAHNVVRLSNTKRVAIFEYMSHHAQSVSAKFLMFSDLKRKPNLMLNAVVSDPNKLDSKGRMIDEVATIVRVDAADDTFRRLVSAA